MESAIETLRQLSLSLNHISEEAAKEMIDEFNKKFAEMFDAKIIDVRLETPVEGGYLLESFSSNTSNPKPYLITKESKKAKKRIGIWAWILENKKPVWIERIPELDLDNQVVNLATDDLIDPIYLKFSKKTHSLAATPMEDYNESFCGIFSMELAASDKLTKETLEKMESVSKYFSRLIKKAKVQELKKKDDQKAAKLFCQSIQHINIDRELDEFRSGFMARQFDKPFAYFGKCIEEYLEKNGIRLMTYQSDSSTTPAISELMNQIRSAHFGIADITEHNPNVMLELGMMMMLGKEIIIFTNSKDDTGLPPFDLQAFQLYRYRKEKLGPQKLPKFDIWDASKSEYVSLDIFFGRFIERLKKELSFSKAKPYGSKKN